MIKAVAIPLAATLAGCAHPEPPAVPGVASSSPRLDELLAFADPRLCEPAPAHERFLAGMVAGDANTGFEAGRLLVPTDLKRAFGRIAVRRHDGWWTVGVPVRGTLFGLPLKEVVHALPEGGDPGDVSYIFVAPATLLEQVLRARGFPAKVGEDVQLGPPDGYKHYMTVRPDPDDKARSILSCGYE